MKKEANIQKVPILNMIVTCRKDGRNNGLVVGFGGNASFDPQMIAVGIVPTRFSYDMVKDTGVFVVNFPAKGYEEEYKVFGFESGRDVDKFEKCDIKFTDGEVVDAPVLSDCPVSFECTVVDSIKPGSHEMFFGKIEKVHCDEEYLDDDGNIMWDKIDLL